LNRKNCLLVIVLLLAASPLAAGLRYEFTESSRTEETSKSTRLTGRAVIEGEMSRLDVLSGNQYSPGSYIISHGQQQVYVVDPSTKSYVQYATDQRRVNPNRVKITSLKTNFMEVKEDGSPIIAGFPTKRYRMQLSYDIEVMVGTITIRQHVESVIDKWLTNAFDHVIGQYRDNVNDLKTGNPEIDALIEAETTKFKGLPLKEQSVIVTSGEKKSNNRNNNLPTTRKRTREMSVSKIEEVSVSPNLFVIPVDFVQGQPTKAPNTTTQYLTMEPDGQ